MHLRRLQQIGRSYLLSIGIWCALSLLTGWQYRIFDRQLNIHSSLLQMILLAESRGIAFAMLTPPIFFIVRRYASDMKRLSALGLYAAGVVPFMIFYACIRWLLLPPWDPVLQMYVPRSAHGPLELIHQGFADQLTIYIALIAAAHAYKYFDRTRQQELEKVEYQRALAASELQALKMQLHPHFLFNTLHGISALVDSDPKSAKLMVVKLSDLLRTALRHSGADLIVFQDELAFIKEYLDLEKMRFGSRLKVNFHIDPAFERTLVPQMILQPLLENAIRHGVASSRGNGWIEISAQKVNGLLELRIRNSVGSGKPSGTGLGLRNTEARLKHLYRDEAFFSFSVSHDQTAITTLRIPILGDQQPLVNETPFPELKSKEKLGEAILSGSD
jgi:two-component system, LytTR family, sensor kinase